MSQQDRIGKTATRVYTDEFGQTHVVYHNTDVVYFNADFIVLNSGGWRTQTTKTRMNQTSHQFKLGYHVYQTRGRWFVTFRGETLPFTDNMLLDRGDDTFDEGERNTVTCRSW